MINVRQKGAGGEREVATALNLCLRRVLEKGNWPQDVVKSTANSVQRNQNQSAVGGCDLSNTFGLAIEIKRQETLSIEAWWTQCTTAATRNLEFPVLIFRQNNGKWRVMMYGSVALPVYNGGDGAASQYASKSFRCEITWENFLVFFEAWVTRKLLAGDYPRV